MKISEEAIDSETLDPILGCANDAAQMLGIDLEKLSPQEIVSHIDNCILNIQKGQGPEIHEEDDPALTLGSLWGQQLVKELGWEWSSVTFHEHDDTKAVGVFSKDRSLAIYPFHFVYGCLENNATVTILLSFNMLVDGKRIPSLPAGGFENVMDNVSHIVPNESVTPDETAN
jgi:hypothetical protein